MGNFLWRHWTRAVVVAFTLFLAAPGVLANGGNHKASPSSSPTLNPSADVIPVKGTPVAGPITGELYPTSLVKPFDPKKDKGDFAVIRFDKELYISKDIALQGIAGYQRVDFSIPRTWMVLDGNKLRLSLFHSPTLIGNLSAFTVILNGRAIMTAHLDEKNIIETYYEIPIPADLLKDFNVLEFIAHQHDMIECEDPFSPSLWTRIHKDSNLYIHFTPRVPIIDLAAFPYPLVEERGYEAFPVTYVLPSNPTPSTLNEVSRFHAGMMRFARFRTPGFNVSMEKALEAKTPVIMIGTASENTAIEDLPRSFPEAAFPLPIRPGVGFLNPNGDPLSADDGVILFTANPANPTQALLVLSGNGPKGVEKAVAAAVQLPYEKSIAGQALVVTKVDPRPKLPARTNRLHIPQATTFTLKDLGFEDLTVRGFYSSPIVIDLVMEPDFHPTEGMQKLRLVYSYGAQVQKQLSSVEVALNGVSIGTKDLSQQEGDMRAELVVDLPASLLGARNALSIRFHLFPDNYFRCGRVSDRHLWATVHKETQFTMPRDIYTYLPNLSFIKFDWYPYTLYQDLQRTTLVVGDLPGAADLKALIAVAGELGRATDSEGIWLKTFYASQIPNEVKASDHLIVIDSTPKSQIVKKLVGNTRLFYNDSNERVLETIDEHELKTHEFKSAGVVEQIISPFNKEGTLLLVRGSNEKAMELASSSLSDPAKVGKLDHNLAFSYDTGDVKSIASVEKQLIGQLPVRKEAQTWLYLNFWQTALLIIGAVILLYVLASLIRLLQQRLRGAKVRINKKDLQ